MHNGSHSPGLASIVLPLRIADSRADEIAMISHELRNSLGVVRNAARLLRFPVGEDGIDGARVLIERHVGQMTPAYRGIAGCIARTGTRRRCG